MTASILVASTTSLSTQASDLDLVSPLVIVPRFAEMKRAVTSLAQVRTIAFTSGHAVDALIGALRSLGHDVRALFGIKLATVGDATAERLERYGLAPDLIGTGGGAELAREIILNQLPDPVLHPRAADGRPELADALMAAGKSVEVVAAYDTRPDAAALKTALLRHAAEPYRAIGFTSPQGFAALLDVFGAQRMANVTLGAIGPTTRDAITAAGLIAAVMPEQASIDALVDALRQALLA